MCVLFSILKQCTGSSILLLLYTTRPFPIFGLFFVCRPILFTTHRYSPRSNMRKIKEKMYIELAQNLINNIDRFDTAYIYSIDIAASNGFLSLLFIFSNNIRNLTFCFAFLFLFIPSPSYLFFSLTLSLKELRSPPRSFNWSNNNSLNLVSLPARSRRWRLETCWWWSSLTWWWRNTFKKWTSRFANGRHAITGLLDALDIVWPTRNKKIEAIWKFDQMIYGNVQVLYILI